MRKFGVEVSTSWLQMWREMEGRSQVVIGMNENTHHLLQGWFPAPFSQKEPYNSLARLALDQFKNKNH
jgi:hypothetical protein